MPIQQERIGARIQRARFFEENRAVCVVVAAIVAREIIGVIALNDGLVSALISFAWTLVFQVLAVLILPLLWEADGIWAAVILAEGLAANRLLTVAYGLFG